MRVVSLTRRSTLQGPRGPFGRWLGMHLGPLPASSTALLYSLRALHNSRGKQESSARFRHRGKQHRRSIGGGRNGGERSTQATRKLKICGCGAPASSRCQQFGWFAKTRALHCISITWRRTDRTSYERMVTTSAVSRTHHWPPERWRRRLGAGLVVTPSTLSR